MPAHSKIGPPDVWAALFTIYASNAFCAYHSSATFDITDPDGTGWWNSSNLVLFGEEVADECIFLVPPDFSDPSIIIANGYKYAIQSEYSNHDHGCIAEKQ